MKVREESQQVPLDNIPTMLKKGNIKTVRTQSFFFPQIINSIPHFFLRELSNQLKEIL